MQFHRLYEDESGASHFEDGRIDLKLADFAPPAPAMHLTEAAPATHYRIVELPAGWTSEPHPAPARQIFFALAGTLEVTASDGETRQIGPGDAWLMEDASGLGHEARVVGADLFRAVIVQLD